jgi:hypothetical protein
MFGTILRAVALAACAFFGGAALAQSNGAYVEGSCGGSYRGLDGDSYACSAKRIPSCERSSGRCECLERKACGGARDEPW